jgi:hypothetical protein
MANSIIVFLWHPISLSRIHKDLSSKGTDLVVRGGGGGGNRDKQEGKMKEPEEIFTSDWSR